MADFCPGIDNRPKPPYRSCEKAVSIASPDAEIVPWTISAVPPPFIDRACCRIERAALQSFLMLPRMKR